MRAHKPSRGQSNRTEPSQARSGGAQPGQAGSGRIESGRIERGVGGSSGGARGRGGSGDGARGPAARPDRAEPESPTDLAGRSWLAALRRSVREFRIDNVTDWAAALTYYGVLALFPGLLIVVAILGLLGDSAARSLLDNVGQIAPGGVRSFLQTVINNAQQQKGAAGVAAVVGLLAALWSASGYIGAFMRASNAIYGVGEGRPIWKTAPVRLAVTVAVMLMLLASAAIVLLTGRVADQLGKAFGIGTAAVTVWDIAKWPVLLILVSLMLALPSWACPNVPQAR